MQLPNSRFIFVLGYRYTFIQLYAQILYQHPEKINASNIKHRKVTKLTNDFCNFCIWLNVPVPSCMFVLEVVTVGAGVPCGVGAGVGAGVGSSNLGAYGRFFLEGFIEKQ